MEDIKKIITRDENGEIKLDEEFSRDLFIIEQEMATLKEREKEYKEALLKAMEEMGIKAIGDENINVTYVNATERFTIDSALMKKEAPTLYDKFKKLTSVSSSVRVSCK